MPSNAGNQRPSFEFLLLLSGQFIHTYRSKHRNSKCDPWTAQQRTVFNTHVGSQEIDGEIQTLLYLRPSLLHSVKTNILHSLKTTLVSSKDHHSAYKQADVHHRPGIIKAFREFLKELQRVLPASGDLGKRKVRASEFDPERIHADENFCYFLISESSFKYLHNIWIFPDLPEPL